MNLKEYFKELKRRHVIRVALAYLVVAWLIVQVASTILPTFITPDWQTIAAAARPGNAG